MSEIKWIGGKNEPDVNGQNESFIEGSTYAVAILGEALNHAAFLHNRTALGVLNYVALHEFLLSVRLENSRIRVFGCAAYIHVYKQARSSSLSYHTQRGLYLGSVNGFFSIQTLETSRSYNQSM